MSAATADRLQALLTPVVTATGHDLESVDVTTAGRRRLLRVTVDKDGGISLDDVALVARAISDLLDGQDVMGGQPYVLEVSSPGVDRPLTEPRHWRRAVSRLVRAELLSGDAVTGRVEAADGDGVDLDVDGHDRRLAYAEVRVARVEVEFGRASAADVADPSIADTDDTADTDEKG